MCLSVRVLNAFESIKASRGMHACMCVMMWFALSWIKQAFLTKKVIVTTRMNKTQSLADARKKKTRNSPLLLNDSKRQMELTAWMKEILNEISNSIIIFCNYKLSWVSLIEVRTFPLLFVKFNSCCIFPLKIDFNWSFRQNWQKPYKVAVSCNFVSYIGSFIYYPKRHTNCTQVTRLNNYALALKFHFAFHKHANSHTHTRCN